MNTRAFRILLLVFLVLGVAVCSDDETSPPAPTVAVSISGAHQLRVGESIALSADTSGAADTGYNWSTSAAAVATVDESGNVTGVASGEAIITATGIESTRSADHIVVVVPELQTPDVFVTVSGNPFVEVGASVPLSANTTGADDAGYAWVSSDETIATVDDEGIVTGVYPGEITITATGADSGESGTLTMVVAYELPHYDEWLASGHADHTAEAFVHWNEDMPAEVPTSCARCHSTPGYLDYLGEDGSAVGSVDAAAPVGTVITCEACHNDSANALEAVTFPSGETVDELGPEARCMVCHQGRSSGDDVEESIVAAAVSSDDEVSGNLSFLNIHYYAAAATINAGRVRGGYQYADQVYDYRFRHAPNYDGCTGCHDPHSLEVDVVACASCHDNVASADDLKDIRMIASLGQDYDGDGDLVEGIYHEIQGLRTKLLQAITTYASESGSGAICYDELAYPYFFKDTNADGACDATEANYGNRYDAWTARLLRAAYNYQVGSKDPGGFAHNGKYIIQLLFDSITDLNGTLTAQVDMASAVRNDFGHFNGASEAARHWDEDEAVSASCSRCHSGSEGFRFFIEHGVTIEVPEQDNGLDCATCHDTYSPDWDILTVDTVAFPGGVSISDPGHTANICGNCHAGRTGKADIDAAIAANNYRFLNVHYLPASAVKKGSEAHVGYEYDTKSYAGEWLTHGRCINCHNPVNTNHTFAINDNVDCTGGCHSPTPIAMVRTNHTLDYDGDTNDTESLHDELAGLAALLLVEIRTEADTTGAPICYDPDAYPYFFEDDDDSGVCDGLEATFSNRYRDWTPALMKAAHNYQIFQKEPGAWAHNFDYVAQLLYDSIEDLGGAGAVSGLTNIPGR